MAGRSSIEAVVDWKHAQQISIPISAALGELADWDDRDCKLIPQGLDYVKVGLCGEARHAFDQRLSALQTRVAATFAAPPQWVTVAYADAEAAGSPPVAEIARFAISSRSAGLLVDTYRKTGVPLTELMSVNELAFLRSTLNQQGLFLAIAGQIQPENISNDLVSIRPQIVAVRSAACLDGDRTQSVSRTAVETIKCRLDSEFDRQATSLETRSTPTSKS